jgi:uncharacterized protein (DUF927 family)
MTKFSKPAARIEFSRKGVSLSNNTEKKLIAAPIRFKAIGTRLADNTMVAQITFMNFDGERISETFNLSQFLPANRNSVVERLADRGYRWPAEKGSIEAILTALTTNLSAHRFKLVGAPGWYDDVYVMPDREYGSKDPTRRSYLIDNQTGASVASLQLGAGSLVKWKEKVANVAKKSSRLRLCISAAFAAPVLRPLGMDSFGLNLYSDTSTGKTSCLIAAASVSGLIGERGLPGWADSHAAIEQLIVGHRDGLVPLDETGDGEDKISLAQKARLLAFAIGRNRPRNLDKGYEKSSKLTTRDCRNIVLSSSERDFGSVAVTEGKPRLGGEEVRLIDVPATDADSQGIFDGRLKLKKGRSLAEQGKRLVDNIRKNAVLNQGFALRGFLRKYTKDANAVTVLNQYKRAFEKQASTLMLQNSDNRICSNFATMYAAAALAIDYGILPWAKKSTLKAINKCMKAALAARRQLSTSQSNPLSTANIAKALQAELKQLHLVKVVKGRKANLKDARRRKEADGFRVGKEIYVKPKRWSGITPANKPALIQHKILRTERGDTRTMARKISGVKGKPRYHVIDIVALDKATDK